jgi:hypothetical protein
METNAKFKQYWINGNEATQDQYEAYIADNTPEALEMPANATVFTDKRTGVQTTALNFTFPDYNKGILSVTRLSKLPWQPASQIHSIIINFKDKNAN